MAQKYSRKDLLNRVLSILNRHSMLENAEKILVGLSGGADSVAMLRLLLELDLGIKIEAAHINHCLRGDESDSDENFVRELCENLGVTLYVLKVDVATRAKELGQGVEECARNIRYEYFASVSDENTRIATAHTLGDSAETVLFNITRGCSINGLIGIPYKRGNIIRPIRNIERAELENYLDELGQGYCTDSTNFTLDYTRNKLRLDIMPRLMTINSALIRSVTSLSERATAAMDIIAGAVYQILGDSCESFDVNALLDAGVALRRECIAEVLRRVGANPSARHIELVDGLIVGGSGAVDVSKLHRFAIEGDRLVYIKNKGSIPYFEQSICLDTEPMRVNLYGDRFITLSVTESTENSSREKNYFACDVLPVSLTIRQPKADDEFMYQNGRHSLMYLYRRGSKGRTETEISEKFVVCIGSEIVFAERFGASDADKVGKYTVACV